MENSSKHTAVAAWSSRSLHVLHVQQALELHYAESTQHFDDGSMVGWKRRVAATVGRRKRCSWLWKGKQQPHFTALARSGSNPVSKQQQWQHTVFKPKIAAPYHLHNHNEEEDK
ncbi:hypothetical protein LR48_Vigan11g039200 [Vigna angularis]|uniref:Uncharacterized protein n=1 Tax=Phaseolus angularis TaxID=3914 RepID=A0A0L9VRH0_PHAAN|nr:hypothetical protein LR48_Vigan11g039200 [Vigna angularis]